METTAHKGQSAVVEASDPPGTVDSSPPVPPDTGWSDSEFLRVFAVQDTDSATAAPTTHQADLQEQQIDTRPDGMVLRSRETDHGAAEKAQ